MFGPPVPPSRAIERPKSSSPGFEFEIFRQDFPNAKSVFDLGPDSNPTEYNKYGVRADELIQGNDWADIKQKFHFVTERGFDTQTKTINARLLLVPNEKITISPAETQAVTDRLMKFKQQLQTIVNKEETRKTASK